jgi:S-DNA-T family DNA segregation ATPase FtsK/SpoIIIE
MNLARQNTPEQIQFYLLDFGNNGLLPLKNLPHVADIVTLEEDEKLTKMLGRLRMILSERKQALKNEGVATLSQYQHKTGIKFPILVNVLDNYDALGQSKRRDEIDEVLIQLLRDGAALGVYLVLTASRYNAIRMNMMSNIQTKLALFLNDESEVTNLFGRERLEQAEIIGRGQTKLDFPVALQVYLPAKGENDAEVLENLEKEISHRNQIWQGIRPEAIPMVPEEIDSSIFTNVLADKDNESIYLGLNKQSAEIEKLDLFEKQSLSIFSENKKQSTFINEFLISQIENFSGESILIDALGRFPKFDASLSIGKEEINNQGTDILEAIQAMSKSENSQKTLVIFNGLSLILDKLRVTGEEFIELVEAAESNYQYILLDLISNVGGNYSALTKAVKENIPHILFGGDVKNQNFIETIPELRNLKLKMNELMYLTDESLINVVLPTKEKNK